MRMWDSGSARRPKCLGLVFSEEESHDGLGRQLPDLSPAGHGCGAPSWGWPRLASKPERKGTPGLRVGFLLEESDLCCHDVAREQCFRAPGRGPGARPSLQHGLWGKVHGSVGEATGEHVSKQGPGESRLWVGRTLRHTGGRPG